MLRERWKEIFITFLLASLSYFVLPTFLQPQTEEEALSLLFNSVPLITMLLMFLSFFLGAFMSRKDSGLFSKQMFVPMFSAMLLAVAAFAANILSVYAEFSSLAFEGAESGQALAFGVNVFSGVLFESFVIIGLAFCALALFRLLSRGSSSESGKGKR